MSAYRRWMPGLALGDINAFFALASDNLALLAGMGAILIGVFHLPQAIVLTRMLPGTALGVLIGDLGYSALAVALARQSGRKDVCAMPFGIDTPSMFALSFGVVGPAYLAGGNAEAAWAVGMAVMVVMGVVKIALAFFGEALQRVLPSSALIAVISAIGVALIMFFSYTKLMAEPVGGFAALAVILAALVARRRLPAWLPAVLCAVLAGGLALWLAGRLGYVPPPREAAGAAFALAWPRPSLRFVDGLTAAGRYLPLALPIALATVVGGIDNAESARLAGDDYRTRDILLVEGVATLVAGLCGGVVQTTPYIGHPAYKRMGARTGYTMATGLVIGVGAACGAIGYLIGVLPDSLLVPILVFVGIEMAVQCGLATPRAEAQAVPLALIPVIAYVVNLEIAQTLTLLGRDPAQLPPALAALLLPLRLLGNGFIVTAMLWVSLVVWMMEGRMGKAALLCLLCALFTLVGVMHSPFADARLFLPDSDTPSLVFAVAGGYVCFAMVLGVMGIVTSEPDSPY